jgi:hypothetical protein
VIDSLSLHFIARHGNRYAADSLDLLDLDKSIAEP